MTRTKTKEEKEFNIEAKKYGLSAYEAKDFDKNSRLKRAVHSFSKSKLFELKDDLSNIEEFDGYYLNFLAEEAFGYGIISAYEHEEVQVIEKTQKLFELISPIPEISCMLYYDINTQGFNLVRTDTNEFREDYELAKKIERWHATRRKIDKIKPFILAQYPHWGKATKKDKKEYIKDMKKTIQNYRKLGVEAEEFDLLLDFLEKYRHLNKITSMKAHYLYLLGLPCITTEELAKKVIKNSKI